jgi:hypothetical protein
VAEPAAGQPDLAEEGCQRDGHPHRLFAVLGPLQTPTDGHQGAPRGHTASQVPDRGRLDTAHRGGEVGVLRNTVGVTEDVRDQPIGSHREPIEEGAVV